MRTLAMAEEYRGSAEKRKIKQEAKKPGIEPVSTGVSWLPA
jgi:hypothetical protein